MIKFRKVTLYVSDDEASDLARGYLQENNIVFEEIKVDGKRVSISKSRLPFLVVRKSYGIRTVSGFSEFQFASALDSTLSYDKFIKMKEKKLIES